MLAGARNVYACDYGDMNSSGSWNVLDVVHLADCVIDATWVENGNCYL